MSKEGKNPVVLNMNNIVKSFPGVLALNNVTMELRKGEVLGLLGENGAGKSTLIKILAGVYGMDSGEIVIDGKPVSFKTTKESLNMGVRVIYQEIPVFEPLTVVENIFSDNYQYTKIGTLDWNTMVKEAETQLKKFGLVIDPLAPMESLSVGERQIVEIVKALHGEAKIIVMDEPTSSLSQSDTEHLYSMVRTLRNSGASIIYITHRMEEIFEITDTILVLRDGKAVGTVKTVETDSQQLVNLIVGKDFSELYPKKNIKKGKIVFEAKNVSYKDVLSDISFNTREGEIVAVYGLVGSGIHKLLNVLVGDLKKSGGELFVQGKKVEIKHPFFAKRHQIGFIPTDRREEGIAASLDVKNNVISANVDRIGRGLLFDRRVQKGRAQKWVDKLNVKTPSINQTIQFLSGGNQQKVVISKWLEADSKILFMSEPSRGIDVGAKAEIYQVIENLCMQGMSVVLVSTELPEIMSISDRILVMKKGRIVKELPTKETSQEELISIVCS